MSAIVIRKDSWDALNDVQREALSTAGPAIRLGDPAVYVDDEGTEWCIFDGHIPMETAAITAHLVERPELLPAKAPKEGEERQRPDTSGRKRPEDVDVPEEADALQEIALAQRRDKRRAPKATAFSGGVPEDWLPFVEEEE